MHSAGEQQRKFCFFNPKATAYSPFNSKLGSYRHIAPPPQGERGGAVTKLFFFEVISLEGLKFGGVEPPGFGVVIQFGWVGLKKRFN